MNVFALPLAGGSPRRVDTGPYDAYHPFFSPTGRWLYFQPEHKDLYRVPGPAQGWATAAPEKVTSFCREELAGYKKPREVVFVDDLPRNALGKVLKHRIREELSEPEE